MNPRCIIWLAVLIAAQPWFLAAQNGSTSDTLQRAIDEFRRQTSRLQPTDIPQAVEPVKVIASSSAAGARAKSTKGAANNGLHGRLYHNFRNNTLDAIPHQIVQRNGAQRKLRRNQFGFNVTGPVILPKIYNGRGKTFVNLSFEGMRESIGQTSLNTIPTTLERTGSWSHVVDFAGRPLPIYDPLTTSLNPNFDPSKAVSVSNLQYNRLQFPGNTIPITRLDAVAQQALQFYPSPNANAGPFFRNNYFVVSQEDNRANGFIATVDHTFLQKNRISVRANRSVGVQGSAPTFLTVANPALPPTNINNREIHVDHIYTATANSINTATVQLTSGTSDLQAPDGPNGSPFSRYDIAGYLGMGTNTPFLRNRSNTYLLQDIFATRRGKHRLSIQGNLQFRQINTFQPQNPLGRFDFTSGLTSLPGIINTGHGFASFLLGTASFAERGVVISPSYFRWQTHQAIVSDQWQLTPSLTLTLGAALRVQVPRKEKYNRQSNISPDEINPANGVPGALVAAGQSGYGERLQRTFAKVEPSLGIAWSVLGDNNTVVRLTVARTYGAYTQSNGHFGTQAFNGTQVWLSSNQQLSPAAVLSDGLQNPRIFPDLRPDAANGTVADWFDTSDRQNTHQSFILSIQRQLAPFLILTGEYDYDYTRNRNAGTAVTNPNAIPLSALVYKDQLNNLQFSNALRPFPQYLNFNTSGLPLGRDLIKIARVQLEKRSSKGLALTVAYRYSLAYDNYSGPNQDLTSPKNEWALAAFNTPSQLTFSVQYELPVGPGRTFLNSTNWVSSTLGGWSISSVGTLSSGNPIALRAQFNNTAGIVPNLRASIVPGVDPHVADPGPGLWFNPAAFVQPDNFTIGNTPRVHPTLRNPGAWNCDLTATKRVPVHAVGTLEVVASMFNALNHANWNDPDNRIGTASAPNVNAGKIIGSTGGRIVQLGLRLNF